MSRPEAEEEYSRAPDGPRGHSAAPEDAAQRAWRRRLERHRGLVLALAMIGAMLLIGAELSPLFHVRAVAARTGATHVVRTVSTGHHDGWALVPIAVVVALISLWAWRTGSRPALCAVALLGAAALVITLARDLPAVHATGLVGSPASGLSTAQARPALGLYLETLGAAIVLISAAAGVLLQPTAAARAARRRSQDASAGSR